MTNTHRVEHLTTADSNTTEPHASAPLPALAFPPAPITDNGQIRLGAQSPMFGIAKGQVAIGAQSPMFPPSLIADAGLVRLGAQSPVL